MKFKKLVKSDINFTDHDLFVHQLANIQQEINYFLGVVDELNYRDPVITQGFKNITKELELIKTHLNID